MITPLLEISSKLVPLFNTWQGTGSILVPSDCCFSQFLLKAQSKSMTEPYPDFHVASCSIASSTPTKDILSSRWSWVSGFPFKTCSICFKLTGYYLRKFFTAKKNLINYFSSFHFPAYSNQMSVSLPDSSLLISSKPPLNMEEGEVLAVASSLREKKQLVCLIKKVALEANGSKDQNLQCTEYLQFLLRIMFLRMTSAWHYIFSSFKHSLQGTAWIACWCSVGDSPPRKALSRSPCSC